MESHFEKIKIEMTKDGSPTAFHIYGSDKHTETMHHTGGALAESIYVFGPAIRHGFEKKFVPKFLSVGLGLGYLEFLIAAHCLQNNEPQIKGLSDDFYIETFESDPRLVKNLIHYLQGKDSDFEPYYNIILKNIEKNFSVDSEDIINLLLEAFDHRSWVIRGALDPQTIFLNKFDVILYDLYSAKTLEAFWTEEFFNNFLSKTVSSSCVFATYAAKSNLKKCLTNKGFELSERPGFQGKRESTLAFKK